MKDNIRTKLLESGAVAVGFAKAGEIDRAVHDSYEKWIGEGCHGEMSYLERHIPLKKDTNNVLEGAKTVISLAFDFTPKKWRSESFPYISCYAYSEDYHVTLRELLNPIVENLKAEYGGKWRVCIDSAPVAERYWAIKSGIGKRGLNGNVIIDGIGALCFLVEILTTLELNPDKSNDGFCDECGACLNECPTKALRGDGTMDARKCINYLTIEKRGEFNEEEKKLIRLGKGYLFGCDRCLRICPYNKKSDGLTYAQKIPDDKILELTTEETLLTDSQEFKRLLSGTPFAYAGYDRLKRNVLALKDRRFPPCL